MFSLRKMFALVAVATLVGGTTTVNAQNRDPRKGPVVLPSIKGNPFPTQPTWPTQPTFPVPVVRCDYRAIHRLADRLEREASRLHDGVDNRFRRTNTYRQLHDEVAVLEAQASRIHALADRQANPALIHQDVQKVDRSVRRIDSLIDDLARFHQVDRSTIVQLRRRLENVSEVAEGLHRELHLNGR